MSIYKDHILIYGWRLSSDVVSSWEYEKREEYYYDDLDCGDVGLVFDGMGCNYAFVGIIIESVNGSSNIPITKIERPTRESERDLYQTVYQEMDLDPTEDPSHYVLTHSY